MNTKAKLETILSSKDKANILLQYFYNHDEQNFRTNQGLTVGDNYNSLTSGTRRPTLA